MANPRLASIQEKAKGIALKLIQKKGGKMKKVVCILVLISVFVAGTAPAANYMYGKKYGTYQFTGLTLDHTYHCANNGSKTYCWSWTGGQSGGSYITNTWGYGNYSKSRCTSTNWGCRFRYLYDGVCHQEANRGLYTSGKTVYKAAGYWASKSVFGTYGKWRSWTTCKAFCTMW